MTIYNVTCKVETSVADNWLQWMKTEHIPDVLATGCFVKAEILRLIEVDDSEGPTYAIQYRAESKALYNRYIEQFAGDMRKKVVEKFGDKVVAFRSVLQLID